MKLDPFTRACVECMFWAETDPDTGHPLEKDYDPADLAPEALERIKEDCQLFQARAGGDIREGNLTLDDGAPAEERAGHDFWLTRNGHGAGFWDGDWREPAASRLTEAAKRFRECNPYVGDDRLIYLTEG